MIHLVTADVFDRYAGVLDRMFVRRHDFYIVERGWKGLNAENGRERDRFDDEHAIYFLALDETGDPIVSARMRPTHDGSLLENLFPHLIAPGEKAGFGRDVWELTRWFIAPAWRGQNGRRIRDYIKVAMIEAAFQRGIRHINLVCDTFFLPSMRATGWRFRHLGLPAAYDEGEAMAVEIQCQMEDVARMREFGAVDVPVIFDFSAQAASASDDPLVVAQTLEALRASPMLHTDERPLLREAG